MKSSNCKTIGIQISNFSDIFLFMYYFKSLLQKEITIHHKSKLNSSLVDELGGWCLKDRWCHR